jgi:hypothetical protein
MQLAIIGGRDFSDFELMKKHLEEIKGDLNMKISAVISGGAKGADSLGKKWADENNVETLIFKAEWQIYGRGAGPVRNRKIIYHADFVIAFWDGESRGTANSINICKNTNTRYKIIKY